MISFEVAGNQILVTKSGEPNRIACVCAGMNSAIILAGILRTMTPERKEDIWKLSEGFTP